MQPFDSDGVYVARWGMYRIRLEITGGVAVVEVRRIEDGGPPLASLLESPSRTATDALAWAAEQIERVGGGRVLIDGRVQSLAEFLRFERVDDVVTSS